MYFPENGGRVTCRALCISMALANLMSFFLGGIPMCHGAGGLASRYRFGARTGGSNLIIGGIFMTLALLLGEHLMGVIYLLPMSALGVLLVFAGATRLPLAVKEFLLRVEILPWDSDAASAYTQLRANCEKKGTPLGTMDMSIAAHAVAVGAVLITNDKAFYSLKNQLNPQDWTQSIKD